MYITLQIRTRSVKMYHTYFLTRLIERLAFGISHYNTWAIESNKKR